MDNSCFWVPYRDADGNYLYHNQPCYVVSQQIFQLFLLLGIRKSASFSVDLRKDMTGGEVGAGRTRTTHTSIGLKDSL